MDHRLIEEFLESWLNEPCNCEKCKANRKEEEKRNFIAEAGEAFMDMLFEDIQNAPIGKTLIIQLKGKKITQYTKK